MLKNHYLVDKPNHPLAREIYKTMRKYSILSPHGHIDSAMLAANKNFANPVELLIIPDHYITRMLHGQGISYEALGIPQSDGRRNNIGTSLDPHHLESGFKKHSQPFFTLMKS
jgi:glucuronate isomerase